MLFEKGARDERMKAVMNQSELVEILVTLSCSKGVHRLLLSDHYSFAGGCSIVFTVQGVLTIGDGRGCF